MSLLSAQSPTPLPRPAGHVTSIIRTWWMSPWAKERSRISPRPSASTSTAIFPLTGSLIASPLLWRSGRSRRTCELRAAGSCSNSPSSYIRGPPRTAGVTCNTRDTSRDAGLRGAVACLVWKSSCFGTGHRADAGWAFVVDA